MGPTVVVFNLGPERGGELTGVAVVNGEAIRAHRLLRAESPFGWRWRRSPECRGSPATRKPAEGPREEPG